ncbi:hypothetical protein Tco_0486772 [Tanacetum coccineum]
MDDLDITMEEYLQLETERALKNGKEYNRKIATYGFLSEPTVSPQHVDEVDLKDETSLLEYDDEEYNVSIRRILVYGYGVSTSCTVLGPSEQKDEFGGMLIFWDSMCVVVMLTCHSLALVVEMCILAKVMTEYSS